MNRQSLVTAWLLSILLSAAASAATVRTVALSGQQAPGAPIGVNYNGFHAPVLNDAGKTAFGATLTGGGVVSGVNSLGIWSEGSGSLSLVARRGDQAPGTPSGVYFGNLNSASLVLNDAGQTAFTAQVTGTDVERFRNEYGIWSEGSGSLALVARAGSQVPGMSIGVNFIMSNLYWPVLNNAGQTAFPARLTQCCAGGNLSIWSEGSGSLALVAGDGQQAPGMPSGEVFGSGGYDFSPVLNDAGQTSFSYFITGSGVSIWSEGSGSLALVAREGDQAPGLPSGVNFSHLNLIPPALNNGGQVAFRVGEQGIWSEGSGSLALVTGVGNQAPGAPNGVYFDYFNSLVLNNAGQTAFHAELTDSRNGIWSEGSGGLALVARAGDRAPGTPSGVNFSFSNSGAYFPVLNDAGQTAFLADLGDGTYGIWATDRIGDLQLIARTGDPLEVAPGDFRTISDISFAAFLRVSGTGNSDGLSSAFNNLGKLAFQASFTDGSQGIIVSNRVAIPEPSSLLLAELVIVAMLTSRQSLR